MMLHVFPGTSSLLPLNQLTLNGGVPLIKLLNVTLIPGKTSSGSGVLAKEGGSRFIQTQSLD